MNSKFETTIVHPRPGARVYLTNEGFHNYEPTKRWGEIIPLTTGRVNIRNTDWLEYKMQQLLKDYSDNDYLCISGTPIIGMLAFGFLLKRDGYVDCLYWDGMAMDYVYRKVTCNARVMPEEFASFADSMELNRMGKQTEEQKEDEVA